MVGSMRSDQAPVPGGCVFGLRLGVAPTKTYPLRRIIRIGGVTRVTIPLDIPPVVALDDADIANFRGAVCEHVLQHRHGWLIP